MSFQPSDGDHTPAWTDQSNNFLPGPEITGRSTVNTLYNQHDPILKLDTPSHTQITGQLVATTESACKLSLEQYYTKTPHTPT